MLTVSPNDLSYAGLLVLRLMVRSDGVFQGRPMMPGTAEVWKVSDLMPVVRTQQNLARRDVENALAELVEAGYLMQLKTGWEKGGYQFTGPGNTYRTRQRNGMKTTGTR